MYKDMPIIVYTGKELTPDEDHTAEEATPSR